jgi:hypothetical protein
METTKPTLTLNNKGVQMLINRMDSHPDEFTRRKSLHPGRWDWVLEQIIRRVEHNHKNTDNYRIELPFLTNEEVDALYDKFMSIQGDAFTHRVMRELLEDESDEISREYDHITDALKYGTGMKKMVIPAHLLEIAQRLHKSQDPNTVRWSEPSDPTKW